MLASTNGVLIGLPLGEAATEPLDSPSADVQTLGGVLDAVYAQELLQRSEGERPWGVLRSEKPWLPRQGAALPPVRPPLGEDPSIRAVFALASPPHVLAVVAVDAGQGTHDDTGQ